MAQSRASVITADLQQDRSARAREGSTRRLFAFREQHIAGAQPMELFLPLIAVVAWVIAKAIGAIADLIREKRRLRLWRYFHDSAIERGQDPDPAEIIRAVTDEGRPPPAAQPPTPPALPSPPKSDDT
jgi:hypothetical protein